MVNLTGISILITAGTNDPIVDSKETTELHELYEDYGAVVEILWHDMGHNLTREEIERAKNFLSES